MFCILVVLYYELLKQNEAITEVLCRTQLIRLSRARAHCYFRREKIIFLHGNASSSTQEILSWEVLPHQLYLIVIFGSISRYHIKILKIDFSDIVSVCCRKMGKNSG